MECYDAGKVIRRELFSVGEKEIHTAIRVKGRHKELSLLVFGTKRGDNYLPIPRSEWGEVSRRIRRELSERKLNLNLPKTRRANAEKLLSQDIYFINDEIDSGKTSGSSGVYAHG